jgi:predicted N-acetyltransferase YhbS
MSNSATPEKIAYTCIIGSHHISIVAVSGHLSAGVINLDAYPGKPNHWWLARLKVAEKHQNQGIGSKLLAMGLEELEKKVGVAGLIVAPGGYGSDEEQLEKWYGARGFTKQAEAYLLWQPRRN